MIIQNQSKIYLWLGLAVSILISCWVQIVSKFSLLTGDGYDGVIENVLVTHWHWVLSGQRIWNEAGYFYPYTDTLGYNDGYFIFGIFASIIRHLLTNQFVAAEMAHILIRAIGYFSFYRLSRFLNLSKFASIFGSVVFTISYSTTHNGHAQLILVGISPLFIYLSVKALASFNNNNFFKYAFAASLLYGAMALTGFYITYFTTLFLITSIFFYLIFTPTNFFSSISRKSLSLLAYWLLFFIIFICPFLIVYLQKLKETGGHQYSEISKNLPTIQDIFNIGDHSLIWGSSLRSFFTHIGRPFGDGELSLGFTPFLFLFFILGSTVAIHNYLRDKNCINSIWFTIVCSTFFWLFCIIDYGSGSLWQFIYSYIPGGKGMRVVSRFFIFLSIPAALLFTLFVDYIYNVKKNKLIICFSIAVTTLEQINTSPFVALDAKEQSSFLSRLAPPPQDCRVFFAINPGGFKFGNRNIDSFYQINVRAMLVSSYFNIPTINGIASFSPPDSNFAYDPVETYQLRISKYLRDHHISNSLCVLDVTNAIWKNY